MNVRPKTSSLSLGRGFGLSTLWSENDGDADILGKISRRRRSR